MRNIENYLETYGNCTFDEKPLCEIDIAILSQITMIDFTEIAEEKITLSDCKNAFYEKNPNFGDYIGLILPPFIMQLFKKIATLDRYKDIILYDYIKVQDEENSVDTASITYRLSKNLLAAAFAGTSDNIVGWREDFILLYSSEIGAHKASIDYLNKLQLEKDDTLIVLGHSKGGHLAMQASAYCNDDIKSKITCVYSLDGPGFIDENLTEAFFSIADRTVEIVPEKSVIGRLFNHFGQLKIVKSDRNGLHQHDVFSWMTDDNNFIWLDNLDEESENVQKEFASVLKKFPPKKREEFANAIFSLMAMPGAKTLTELERKKSQFILGFFKLDLKEQMIIDKVFINIFTKKHMAIMLGKSIFLKFKEIHVQKKASPKQSQDSETVIVTTSDTTPKIVTGKKPANPK